MDFKCKMILSGSVNWGYGQVRLLFFLGILRERKEKYYKGCREAVLALGQQQKD